MPPARAAPGWSPSRAVLAGRDAPARVRARAALRGARQRRLSRPRWAASGPRAVGRRTTPTQLKIGHGAASGAAPPHLFPPEAPPRERYPSEAVQRPLRGPLDGTGAVNPHMYSSEPTSVTPLPSLARGNIALQRTEELPGRAKYERCVTPSSRGRTYAKKRQPQRRAWQ